jgi:hypothetical protein
VTDGDLAEINLLDLPSPSSSEEHHIGTSGAHSGRKTKRRQQQQQQEDERSDAADDDSDLDLDLSRLMSDSDDEPLTGEALLLVVMSVYGMIAVLQQQQQPLICVWVGDVGHPQ